MKSRIKNFCKYLATAILGLFGISSCEPACMYGSPFADFRVLGTVKDEAGKPIEGIKVTVTKDWGHNGDADYKVDNTIYTDAKGQYLLDQDILPSVPAVTILFEDVDGAANGGDFSSAEVKPEVKNTPVKDSNNSWKEAIYDVRADVVLKKK